MLIDGHNLFPLNNIDPNANGYFMDTLGYIYSQRARKGQLTKLIGSITNSGHYYTLGGRTIRADDLTRNARNHKSWGAETSGISTEAADILNQIRARSTARKNADMPRTDILKIIDRTYAQNMNAAILNRGVLIASVQDDKLLFGTNPRIHVGEESWKAEMQRFAKVAPGTKFVALQIITSVVAGGLKWE